MAYTLDISLALGSGKAGLSDLRAQLMDTAGADVGSAVSTGFSGVGAGNYLWHYAAFPDNHRGGVRFYSNAAPTTVLAFVALNPEEAEIHIICFGTVGGSADNSVQLIGGSSTNDFYNGCWVRITSGTGAGQVRLIIDYSGSGTSATIYPNWTVNPSLGDTYTVLPVAGVSDAITVTQLLGGVSINNAGIAMASFDADTLPILVWAARALTMIEADGAVYRYTANALELAPASTLSVSDILSAVVPASYAPGTVGYNLGRMSTGRVTVSSIVAASGEVRIVQGDDYYATDGRSIDFTGDDPNQWPDLTGSSIVLHVSDGTLSVNGSVVTPTGTQQIRFQPTSSQTTQLAEGTYDFRAVATLSNTHVVTLIEGRILVADTESS